ENERKLIEHTPRYDPGGAIMTHRTLAVRIDLSNSQMVSGGPSMKSLVPCDMEILGKEMSPGFQMLIQRGPMQIARTPRMGLQLIRLRVLERETSGNSSSTLPDMSRGCHY